MLITSNEEAKVRCMKAYREEKKKVKGCIYRSKKKVNENFGREMNVDMNGNMKLFWKESQTGVGLVLRVTGGPQV